LDTDHPERPFSMHLAAQYAQVRMLQTEWPSDSLRPFDPGAKRVVLLD